MAGLPKMKRQAWLKKEAGLAKKRGPARFDFLNGTAANISATTHPDFRLTKMQLSFDACQSREQQSLKQVILKLVLQWHGDDNSTEFGVLIQLPTAKPS